MPVIEVEQMAAEYVGPSLNVAETENKLFQFPCFFFFPFPTGEISGSVMASMRENETFHTIPIYKGIP